MMPKGGVAFLASQYAQAHPRDAARALEPLPTKEVAAFLEPLQPAVGAAVLEAMGISAGAECLSMLPQPSAAALVQVLPSPHAVAMVRRMGPDVQRPLLEGVTPGLRRRLGRTLRFPLGTVGAAADSDVETVGAQVAVGEARRRVLRKAARVPYIYVLDQTRGLAGVTTRRELARAPAEALVRDYMQAHVQRLSAEADLAEVGTHPAWNTFDVLPVVDKTGAFLGVIRHKTIRQLEAPMRPAARWGGALPGVISVSEAYWLGLTRLLSAVGEPASGPTPQPEGVTHE